VIDDILELGGKSGEIHFRIWKKLAKNMLVTKVLFVWVNYKNDFVKGLVEWGLALPNIVNDLDFVKKWDILIFEWRRAKRWLDRFVK
jgi:hypothetical protein